MLKLNKTKSNWVNPILALFTSAALTLVFYYVVLILLSMPCDDGSYESSCMEPHLKLIVASAVTVMVLSVVYPLYIVFSKRVMGLLEWMLVLFYAEASSVIFQAVKKDYMISLYVVILGFVFYKQWNLVKEASVTLPLVNEKTEKASLNGMA